MNNPIFDLENWKEISATLARNKTRTFLTAFGIFWGTAMLAMLMGGASGLKGILMRNFDGFATNMAAIFPQTTTMSYRGFNKGLSWRLTQTDVDNIRRRVEHIEASSGIGQQSVTIAYATKSLSSMVSGVESDYFKIQLPKLYSGRLLNENDIFSTRKVVVIGKNIADELFGEESPLGKYVNMNGVYFQVVGVAGQTADASIGGRIDDNILMPLSTMRRTFNMGNNIDFLILSVKSGHSPADIKESLFRTIRSSHPIHPEEENAIGMMNGAEMFEMVDNLFLGIRLLAIFVGAGTLIAGIIGVGNIMWIIVKERTQEIGIRRAIGAKPRDIIVQILSEGVVLTSVAGTAGVCFAAIVLAVADKITSDPLTGSAHFQLPFSSAITIMIIFLFLGTIAGLIPSIKAMRIKPVEAMNDK